MNRRMSQCETNYYLNVRRQIVAMVTECYAKMTATTDSRLGGRRGDKLALHRPSWRGTLPPSPAVRQRASGEIDIAKGIAKIINCQLAKRINASWHYHLIAPK